jgi:hypothetical protein
MFWRKSPKSEQWALQNLLQRLAAVDEGGLLLHHDSLQVKAIQRRRSPFLFAGLVCAVLASLLILAIVSFVSGRAPEDRAPYALTTTTTNDHSVEPAEEGRLLWWKFPHPGSPMEKHRGSSGK